MTEAPWLTSDGHLRCFYCETRRAYPQRDVDPDARNDQLRESHRLLWSKPLAGGPDLELSGRRWSDYLKVESLPGHWSVGSDNFATTHANALPTLSAGLDSFTDGHLCALCTIGGYIVFPNVIAQQLPNSTNLAARRWSVNQARGMEARISDRFDLTLEAIRLFYQGAVLRTENPIGDVLEAYRWWFDLFGKGAEGFHRFADFFFLTPILDTEEQVKSFGGLGLAFDRALPKDETAYGAYVADQVAFVTMRNELITDWWNDQRRP